ncbi:DUF456 domain-containing protein [Aneurinibacillus uraniidurans]|uniref:DUF456 domain-containing protein n=1 Tax=Aneurinibacillus uraniidurans TaxID=2966586 RepID=UPI00234BA254|nr:DUF456 family protein [Aneurinibacillus sp. B1]WCN36465.1 DUF456 family protein [Aneurinibacillus sp. B1]
MDAIIWTGIGVLFLLSLAGVIIPIIPDALLVWIGFLTYKFALGHVPLTWTFWVPMTVLTALLIGADLLSNAYFLKKYGGDKWSMIVATVGLLAGPLLLGAFLGPFAILVGPFLAVWGLEVVRGKGALAMRIATGTVLGFLSSTVAKIIIQLVMIIWFLIVVL